MRFYFDVDEESEFDRLQTWWQRARSQTLFSVHHGSSVSTGNIRMRIASEPSFIEKFRLTPVSIRGVLPASDFGGKIRNLQRNMRYLIVFACLALIAASANADLSSLKGTSRHHG